MKRNDRIRRGGRQQEEDPWDKMERQIEEDDKELRRLTLEYLNRWPSIFRPKPGYDWKVYAVRALRDFASPLLRQLERVDFKGDEEIVELIANLACKLTDILNLKTDREAAKNIARRRYYWPFLKARQEKYSDHHRKIVKELCLGESCPLNADAALRARATPNQGIRIDQLVIRYLCKVNENREHQYSKEFVWDWPEREWLRTAATLAPLSPGNWRQWADVAWQALADDYDGHPALDPMLAAIGKPAIASYKRRFCKKSTPAPETTEKVSEKRIREKFLGAVQTLAGKPRRPRKGDSVKS